MFAVPALQLTHADTPATLAYDPGAHCTHVVDALLCSEKCPTGHVPHTDCPVAAANVPASHATHVVWSLAALAELAVPALHGMHVD